MYVTYGITDRWDVNLLVPLAYSEMRVRARRQFSPVLSDGSIGDPLAEAARRSADGDAFGIGDVLVRTKYRLVDAAPLGVASALTIRAPSGAEDDFQGLGDVTVTPALVLSYPFGPHSVHANLGMEFNADDIERTRGRYNIGGAFQLFEHLLFLDQTAFLVEFLGSSGLGDDEFDLPAGNISPANLPPGPGLSHVDLNTIAVDRTDLLDLAAGLKVALPGNGVLYAGAIIPLNDDGVRVKDAIPTGGVEFGF
jgi:hypothetical protein